MNAIYLSREPGNPQDTDDARYNRSSLDQLEERIWELMEIGQPCDPSNYENIGEAMDCIYEGDRKALEAAVRAEDACEVGRLFLHVVRTHCEDKAQLMAWRGE